MEGLNGTEGKMEKQKFNKGTTLELDRIKISTYLLLNVIYRQTDGGGAKITGFLALWMM